MPKKQKLDAKSALEKIKELLGNAKGSFGKSPALAKDFVRKAKNLAMSRRIKLPLSLKRKFCKKCNSLWIPGKTVRMRIRNKKIVYYCLSCRKFTRVGIE